MTIAEPTDGNLVLECGKQVLCPRVRPGRLVSDNLSKLAGVRERIEAAGAHLLYRPRYSSDRNPSEQAWSKGKQILRLQKAHSSAALESADSRRTTQ